MSLSEVVLGAAASFLVLAACLAARARRSASGRPFRILLAAGLVVWAASLVAAFLSGRDSVSPWTHTLALAGSVLLATGLGVSPAPARPAAPHDLRGRLSAPGFRQAAARLEAMFRNSPDALLLCTREGTIVDSNRAAEMVTGSTQEQLRGTPLSKVIDILDDRPDRIALALAGRISGDLSGTREYRVRTSTGRTLWLEVDSRPVLMGEETFVLISARNVTERKAGEARVRGYRARLDLMGDALPALLWTTDSDMRIRALRGRALELAESGNGMVLTDVFQADAAAADVATLHARAMAGEKVSFRWRAADQAFEGAMLAMPDADGRPVGVVGLALDVTERERATAQAEEKEKTLHAILDHAPAIVFLKDLEGRHLWVNRQWELMSRRSRESAVGKNDYDLYPKEIGERFLANDRQVIASGEPMSFVETLRGRKRTRAYLSSKFLLRRPDGEPYALCGIATDISERIRLEEELRHRQAILDEAQTMAGLASWELDLRGDEHYWAPKLREMLGMPDDLNAGFLTFLGYVHEDDRPYLLEKTALCTEQGIPFQAEFRAVHRDGSVRWLFSQGRIDHDEQGPTRFYGFTQDITERKAAAEALQKLNAQLEETVRRRTEQLEHAVEELTAFGYAVSHDLRQPLRAIAGHLGVIGQDAGITSEEVRQYMTRVHAAVGRMGALIGDLLALSQVSHAKLRHVEVDLAGMAREIAAELGETEPGREVEWTIAEELLVHADAGLMRILLGNLLGNAFKFTRDRSPARIELGSSERGGERSYFVRDNGAGFDQAFSHRLFEPFQRLHDVGAFEGNGIGLATVARIVRRHGGWIRAQAKPGAGATLTFTIPSIVSIASADGAVIASADGAAPAYADGAASKPPPPESARRV